MEMYVNQATSSLPVRARVALALISAEHVLPALDDHPDVLGPARRGLENGWQWAGGGNVRALRLYQQIDPLAYASMDFDRESPLRSAMFAVTAALYCVTREALNHEKPDASDQQYDPFGSDIADVVGEEALRDCLSKALDSSADRRAEADWQQRMVERLLTIYETKFPQQLGPPIAHNFFPAD